MRFLKIYRSISIATYFLIILKGQMIGIPFFFWLLFSVFNFGYIDQVFALMAASGLILIFRNWNKTRTQKILLIDFSCFILLVTPIIGRLSDVPLYMFNYMAFIVPTAVFVFSYLISLNYSCKQFLSHRRFKRLA